MGGRGEGVAGSSAVLAGGDERAADAGATCDRAASRGDAQSRSSQSGADIRAITLSTVLKILARARARAAPRFAGTR